MVYANSSICAEFSCRCDDCDTFNSMHKNCCCYDKAECQNCNNCIWFDGDQCCFEWERYTERKTKQFYDMNAQMWVNLNTQKPIAETNLVKLVTGKDEDDIPRF